MWKETFREGKEEKLPFNPAHAIFRQNRRKLRNRGNMRAGNWAIWFVSWLRKKFRRFFSSFVSHTSGRNFFLMLSRKITFHRINFWRLYMCFMLVSFVHMCKTLHSVRKKNQKGRHQFSSFPRLLIISVTFLSSVCNFLLIPKHLLPFSEWKEISTRSTLKEILDELLYEASTKRRETWSV